MLGVIGGAMGTLLVRQQRFYRGAGELLYAREGVRDAIDVLETDLRGIASADTVRLLADSAVEMFTSIGGSVLCQASSDTQLGLAPATANGTSLGFFASQPDTGDLALFYRATATDSVAWERHRIAGFDARSLATTCPPTSGFSSATDVAAGAEGYELSLETHLSASVRPGAAVRFIRRGRYSLYRASDGEWYLGYRRCNAIGASECGGIQPLSGPYRAYSRDRKATGLLFEYFDDHGSQLTSASSPRALSRIDVTVRAESKQQLLIEGHPSRPADSAQVSIAVRNR
jgi:hypothetical protein